MTPEMMQRCLDTQGWMTEDELMWLYNEARAVGDRGLIAEVGCWKGRSTMALCAGATGDTKVCTIDAWCGSDDPGDETAILTTSPALRLEVMQQAMANLQEYRENGKLTIMAGHTKDVYNTWQHWAIRCDMVFIDGGHDLESILRDLRYWSGRAGVVCGHDCNWKDVKAAVNAWFPRVEEGPGSIWCYRKDS